MYSAWLPLRSYISGNNTESHRYRVQLTYFPFKDMLGRGGLIVWKLDRVRDDITNYRYPIMLPQAQMGSSLQHHIYSPPLKAAPRALNNGPPVIIKAHSSPLGRRERV